MTRPRQRRRTPAGRTLARALALAAFLLSGSAIAQAQEPRTLEALLRDTVLDNGLHVIVVPNPTVPLATVQVVVRNGAFTQLREEDVGTAHLLEHMLFKAFGSSGFGAEAGKLDAAYNGSTSDETVMYFVNLPSKYLEDGVELMADLVRAPRFAKDKLKSEQQVVRGELERRAADADWLLFSSVDRVLWGDGYPRKNTIGNVPAILGATAESLTAIYQRWYVPNNAALVVTGDVAPAAVFAHAAKHFRGWKRAPDPFEGVVIPPMPPLAKSAVVTVPLDVNDVTLLVRWQGPSVRADRAASRAADLFAEVVNHPLSGVQLRLVDTGLFQSVSMYTEPRVHGGDVTLRALTTSDQLVAASAALRRELDAFGEPGWLTPALLSYAQKRVELSRALWLESPSELASYVGDLWSVAGLDFVRGYLPAMRALEPSHLESFVRTYLVQRPRVTGVLLSPVTRHELGPRLEQALAPWRQ